MPRATSARAIRNSQPPMAAHEEPADGEHDADRAGRDAEQVGPLELRQRRRKDEVADALRARIRRRIRGRPTRAHRRSRRRAGGARTPAVAPSSPTSRARGAATIGSWPARRRGTIAATTTPAHAKSPARATMPMLTAASCPPATTAPCRRSRSASGSRAIAVPGAGPSTTVGGRERATRPAVPDPSCAETGDRRRPTRGGGHDRRRQERDRRPSTARPGRWYGAGVAGRQVGGGEPGQVGSQRGRPLGRHGLGAVGEDEHEVVAATERRADLIDGRPAGVEPSV